VTARRWPTKKVHRMKPRKTDATTMSGHVIIKASL